MEGKGNKKGELTSRQIVIIVILIISFGVILLFFLNLNLKSEINAETCRNSVALRGTPLGKSTSLNCKTQSVCFTKSGDDCRENVKGTIEIKVNNKNELLDELSDRMYNCWWQMGRGEVDYTPTNWGVDKVYCAICDRMYFSDSIKGDSSMSEISYRDFFTYLKSKKSPSGGSDLLLELTGLRTVDAAIFEDEGDAVVLDSAYDFSRPQGWVLITGMTKEGWGGTIIGGAVGAAVGVVAVVAAPFTGGLSLAGAGIVAANIAGGAGIGIITTGSGGDFNVLAPSIIVNDGEILQRKMGCYEFSTLP